MDVAFQYIWGLIFDFWNDLLSGFEYWFGEFRYGANGLQGIEFNIYLFSDTGWFASNLNLWDLTIGFLSVLTFIIIFKLLYKIIKLPFRFFK